MRPAKFTNAGPAGRTKQLGKRRRCPAECLLLVIVAYTLAFYVMITWMLHGGMMPDPLHHLPQGLSRSRTRSRIRASTSNSISNGSPTSSFGFLSWLRTKLGTRAPPPKFTTDFVFPSNEERIRYYMGDWHGRTLTPEDVPCSEISMYEKFKASTDKAVLWTLKGLEKEVAFHKEKQWQVNSYLNHSMHVLRANVNATGYDGDRRMVLWLGDSHSKSERLPAVAKTRFSRFARNKKNATFFDPIIWPLAMYRHYTPVQEYLQLEREGKVTAWENKTDSLIWRGGFTGSRGDKPQFLRTYPENGHRYQVVKRYFNANRTNVDVAFKKGDQTVKLLKGKFQEGQKWVRDSDTSMESQVRRKYLLVIEGNDVATSLKWQLASNSVVFMARPICVSFLMEDKLVPFVHYVPLKDDYSNLVEMVEWARKNDDRCRWISEQATEYMKSVWMSEEAQRSHNLIRRELGDTYHRQFGEALKSCKQGSIGGGGGARVAPREDRSDIYARRSDVCEGGAGTVAEGEVKIEKYIHSGNGAAYFKYDMAQFEAVFGEWTKGKIYNNVAQLRGGDVVYCGRIHVDVHEGTYIGREDPRKGVCNTPDTDCYADGDVIRLLIEKSDDKERGGRDKPHNSDKEESDDYNDRKRREKELAKLDSGEGNAHVVREERERHRKLDREKHREALMEALQKIGHGNQGRR